MGIHPTAIIDPTAELDSTVTVGPYCLIGPRVTLGNGTELIGHVSIDKDTQIGANCRLFPFASVGADPQDMKYQGERTQLVIGDRVTIRESATIHRGTALGGGVTRVGDDVLIMATVHVAHDCQLGNGVILSSFAVLAGHVKLGPHATVSGSAAIHQFVRVGDHAFIGGMSGVVKDVPPYMIFAGVRDKSVLSPNVVGLKRRDFTPEQIEVITSLHRLLRGTQPLAGVLQEAEKLFPNSLEAQNIISFYRSSERGVYR
ncbi:MAG: acyl-ACP--UDP-N-acetylglucosamine O-acyltransferase [Deltaproteobacteria bacterium]|jgi:UDP-N-acetylglucosamine acyltransferase|nr:acyl-ACP--UDP-N-acetylglucosamine O-acyltransferase [Deltaproteobacteria bacterium]